MTNFFKRKLDQFRRSEDGLVAFDFVLWVPFFLFIMVMGIEVGLIGVKHVKLERSMDATVRWVRLNTGATPTHDDLKAMICSTNPVPSCTENVQLEMVKMNLRDWQNLPETYSCVDRSETVEAMDQLSLGMDNELMVLRVCAEFSNFMPSSGLYDKFLGTNSSFVSSEGDYRSIRKTTAFVQEPR